MVFIDLHRDSPNGFWWSPKFGMVYNHDPLFGPVIINPPRVSPHKISPSAEIYFFNTRRSWWSPGSSSSSLSAPYMVAFEGVQSRGAQRWTSRFILYIATEKMRILVPWPFRRVNFELLESREKKIQQPPASFSAPPPLFMSQKSII